jgi:hypothetical protein
MPSQAFKNTVSLRCSPTVALRRGDNGKYRRDANIRLRSSGVTASASEAHIPSDSEVEVLISRSADGTITYQFGAEHSTSQDPQQLQRQLSEHVDVSQPASGSESDDSSTSQPLGHSVGSNGLSVQRSKDADKTGNVVEGAWSEMTLKQLHEYCKEHGLTGYSALRKGQLIEKLESWVTDASSVNLSDIALESESDDERYEDLTTDNWRHEELEGLTVRTLQVLCKRHGLTGYSQLRKAEIVDMLWKKIGPQGIGANTECREDC